MKRICIVEDEYLIASHLKLLLSDLKYEVCSVVDNFHDAICAAKKYTPDYFFMDINILGKYDGIYTAQEILKMIVTKIIFQSSDAEKFHFDRIKHIPYTAYLDKPVDENSISEILKDRIKL